MNNIDVITRCQGNSLITWDCDHSLGIVIPSLVFIRDSSDDASFLVDQLYCNTHKERMSLLKSLLEISQGKGIQLKWLRGSGRTQFKRPSSGHFIIKTGDNLVGKMPRTVALFRCIDLRSLDADSDKTYPLVRRNVEPQSGLARVRR